MATLFGSEFNLFVQLILTLQGFHLDQIVVPMIKPVRNLSLVSNVKKSSYGS